MVNTEGGYRLWINDENKYEFLDSEGDLAQQHYERFKDGAYQISLERYFILENYRE